MGAHLRVGAGAQQRGYQAEPPQRDGLVQRGATGNGVAVVDADDGAAGTAAAQVADHRTQPAVVLAAHRVHQELRRPAGGGRLGAHAAGPAEQKEERERNEQFLQGLGMSMEN